MLYAIVDVRKYIFDKMQESENQFLLVLVSRMPGEKLKISQLVSQLFTDHRDAKRQVGEEISTSTPWMGEQTFLNELFVVNDDNFSWQPDMVGDTHLNCTDSTYLEKIIN